MKSVAALLVACSVLAAGAPMEPREVSPRDLPWDGPGDGLVDFEKRSESPIDLRAYAFDQEDRRSKSPIAVRAYAADPEKRSESPIDLRAYSSDPDKRSESAIDQRAHADWDANAEREKRDDSLEAEV